MLTIGPGVRAAIYTRISDDAELTGLGIARQRAECEAVVRQRGWSLVAIHSDNDISAFLGHHRPAYDEMVRSIVAGQVDAIVAAEMTRLHRSVERTATLFSICRQHRVAIVTLREGTYDFADDAQGGATLQGHIMAAMGEWESRVKSERVRSKHRQIMEQGGSPGFHAPFGYDRDMNVIPEQAEVIVEAADAVLRGESLRSIAGRFTATGRPSPHGDGWLSTTLRNLLVSGRISGRRDQASYFDPAAPDVRRRYRIPPIVADASWPAIITPEMSDRLRAHFAASPGSGNRPRTNWLSGLVYCGSCGHLMRLTSGAVPSKAEFAATGYPRRRALTCGAGAHTGHAKGDPGCGKLVSLWPLEQYVARVLVAAVDSGQLQALISRTGGERFDRAQAEIETVDAEFVQLARDRYSSPPMITDGAYQAARDILNARRQEAMRVVLEQRAVYGLEDVPSPLTMERWAEMTFTGRRSIVRALVERIDILPRQGTAPRFDPGRVRINWRA